MHPTKDAFFTRLIYCEACQELKDPTVCLISPFATNPQTQTTTTAPETTETPNASDVHFAHLPNVLDPTPPVAPEKTSCIHPQKNQELQAQTTGRKNWKKKSGKVLCSISITSPPTKNRLVIPWLSRKKQQQKAATAPP